MNAYKCDICGNFYVKSPKMIYPYFRIVKDTSPNVSLDLCPNCCLKLREFIRKPNEGLCYEYKVADDGSGICCKRGKKSCECCGELCFCENYK